MSAGGWIFVGLRMGMVWFVGSMLTVLNASLTPVQSSPMLCMSRAR